MDISQSKWFGLLAWVVAVVAATVSAAAQQQKPNILFIMGDYTGWMQPSIYHRGLMVGETPNIDRIGNEGAIFMDYVAMQSCTSGRNAFLTGMYPDITYNDADWGMTDQSWEGIIECEHCPPCYSFRTADAQH
jgi:hypothetical protein